MSEPALKGDFGQGGLWAVVLAGGDGRRLRGLTTTGNGTVVPKQYCSLHGGPSLLQQALRRAERIVRPERLCAIVAARHARWWREQLRTLPPANLIVQPENRGTANGVLLSLLSVVQRDSGARLVFLPADHYVRDEGALIAVARAAAERAQAEQAEVMLLGMEPSEADTELGYILPERGAAPGALRVARFLEKPSAEVARAFIECGALWNTFIVVADAQALLRLFLRRYPRIVAELRAGLGAAPRQQRQRLTELYEGLADLDFSRHILQGQESYLTVLRVPSCGWTDLGTPRRVGEALRQGGDAAAVPPYPQWRGRYLNLAAQHRRSQLELTCRRA